ncbi:MAG: hypothetical protein ACOC1N_05060 [Bacillota bacterium]
MKTVNNFKWEKCPRCGGNKVQEESYWGFFFKCLFMTIFMTITTSLVGVSFYLIMIFFIGGTIFSILSFLLAIVNTNNTNLKCQGCDFMWQYPYKG